LLKLSSLKSSNSSRLIYLFNLFFVISGLVDRLHPEKKLLSKCFLGCRGESVGALSYFGGTT
jgi:hypothetical protein